MPSYEMKQLH